MIENGSDIESSSSITLQAFSSMVSDLLKAVNTDAILNIVEQHLRATLLIDKTWLLIHNQHRGALTLLSSRIACSLHESKPLKNCLPTDYPPMIPSFKHDEPVSISTLDNHVLHCFGSLLGNGTMTHAPVLQRDHFSIALGLLTQDTLDNPAESHALFQATAQVLSPILAQLIDKNYCLKLTLATRSHDSSFIVAEHSGNIVFASEEFCERSGYRQNELIAENLERIQLALPDIGKDAVADLYQFLHKRSEWSGMSHSKNKNGDVYWAHCHLALTQGDVQYLVITLSGYAQVPEEVSQKMNRSSLDDLTGLLNRRTFEERLQQAIKQTTASHLTAYFYMDLDQFKVVNEACGHIAGDELLRQIARLLRRTVGRQGDLARLGSDEFGLLLENVSLAQIERYSDKILQAVKEYLFRWSEQIFDVGLCIGISIIDDDAMDFNEVMKRADAACYAAKENGRNLMNIYHDGNESKTIHAYLEWVPKIIKALKEDKFVLYAQRIESLQPDSKGDYFELLLRMRDKTGKLIGPGEFLPAAEKFKVIDLIDEWVVRTAFQWLRDHPDFMESLDAVSINLSGISVTNGRFLDYIQSMFRSTGILPEKINFEITETIAISNLQSATIFIDVLKTMGVRFSLDDFGSGLSSFSYLKSLPVDTVKIDGQFVKDMLVNQVDRAMVKSIHEVAAVMGIKTVAEFVENEQIKGALQELGIDYAQGYGICKPLPIEHLSGLSAM